MNTCDRCLDGRHVRCSRGDCACSNCRRPQRDPRLAGRALRTAAQRPPQRRTPGPDGRSRPRGRQNVRWALQPNRFRTAEIMRRNGAPYREIADALGVAHSTVRETLLRSA